MGIDKPLPGAHDGGVNVPGPGVVMTSKASRHTSQRFPVHIRSMTGNLRPPEREYVRRKLGAKLGKYAGTIERVSVRLKDENGPRGGVDQLCRIKVVLRGMPSVVFESRNAALNAGVDTALSGIERAVRRSVQRRRMKPLRRGALADAAPPAHPRQSR